MAESAAGPGLSAGREQDVLEALSTVVGYDCASTFSATELAWPTGLRGGLGMTQVARDGRETGF